MAQTINPDSLDRLVSDLGHADADRRQAAIEQLGLVATGDEQVAETLNKLVAWASDPRVREAARAALQLSRQVGFGRPGMNAAAKPRRSDRKLAAKAALKYAAFFVAGFVGWCVVHGLLWLGYDQFSQRGLLWLGSDPFDPLIRNISLLCLKILFWLALLASNFAVLRNLSAPQASTPSHLVGLGMLVAIVLAFLLALVLGAFTNVDDSSAYVEKCCVDFLWPDRWMIPVWA